MPCRSSCGWAARRCTLSVHTQRPWKVRVRIWARWVGIQLTHRDAGLPRPAGPAAAAPGLRPRVARAGVRRSKLARGFREPAVPPGRRQASPGPGALPARRAWQGPPGLKLQLASGLLPSSTSGIVKLRACVRPTASTRRLASPPPGKRRGPRDPETARTVGSQLISASKQLTVTPPSLYR